MIYGSNVVLATSPTAMTGTLSSRRMFATIMASSSFFSKSILECV